MIDVFAGRQWRDRSIGEEVKVEPQENLKGMLWGVGKMPPQKFSFCRAESVLLITYFHPPVIIDTKKENNVLYKDQLKLKTLMTTGSESAT